MTAQSAQSTVPRLRGFGDHHPFFVLTQWVVAGALHLLADVHAEGMERCPPSGGLVLASNHRSMLDIPLIGAWCPRTTLFFAKSEVRNFPVVGFISYAYGTLYVRRGESDRQAVRDALTAMALGRVIGMFPEGHRTRTGGLQTAQPGVALLAQRAKVPVWPVAVTGTERIGKDRRPRVTIRGGDAFDPVAAARGDFGGSPTHQQVADAIMRRIAALLPEHYRGAYL